MIVDAEAIVSGLPVGWSMWDSAGGIVLQLRADGHTENLTGATLTEVLEKAAGYRHLPRITRQPAAFDSGSWAPRKRGPKWVMANVVTDREVECTFPTRKAVSEAIERWSARSKEEREEWQQKFDAMFPNGATEGVDFRWVS